MAKRPSFGTYLLALFLPPLFFITRKRYIAAIINLILCVVSIPFFFVFGSGIFLWLLCATWSMWNLKNEVMDNHIQAQAEAIVAATEKAKVSE